MDKQEKTGAAGETAEAGGGFDSPAFTRALERWFQSSGRHDLPWRLTRDPYAVLVSELMLQQTQVATVVRGRYFERWLESFPDLQTLAAAGEEQVLKAWEGLGYYRRARTLHMLAKQVVADGDGVLPSEAAALRELPGIGPYTAGAVASLAFGRRSALVDGNVARILARVFDFSEPIDAPAGTRWSWRMAEELVQACHDPSCLNQALMELGQTICTPAQPKCHQCPVRPFCLSGTGQGIDPGSLPVKKPVARPTEVEESALWWWRDGRILLQQIPEGERRAGLWRLPQVDGRDRDRQPLHRLTYGITRYRVRLTVFEPAADEPPPAEDGFRWFDAGQRAQVAIAAPYLKAITRIEQRSDDEPMIPGL